MSDHYSNAKPIQIIQIMYNSLDMNQLLSTISSGQ